MVKIWRNRIWAGTQSLNNCPLRYKVGAMELMSQDVSDGVHSITELKELVKNEKLDAEDYETICGEGYSDGND